MCGTHPCLYMIAVCTHTYQYMAAAYTQSHTLLIHDSMIAAYMHTEVYMHWRKISVYMHTHVLVNDCSMHTYVTNIWLQWGEFHAIFPMQHPIIRSKFVFYVFENPLYTSKAAFGVAGGWQSKVVGFSPKPHAAIWNSPPVCTHKYAHYWYTQDCSMHTYVLVHGCCMHTITVQDCSHATCTIHLCTDWCMIAPYYHEHIHLRITSPQNHL